LFKLLKMTVTMLAHSRSLRCSFASSKSLVSRIQPAIQACLLAGLFASAAAPAAEPSPGKIAAGYGISFSIGTDGTFQSWGIASRNGAGVERLLPGLVDSNTNWVDAAGSYVSTAAIKTDGTLWTWGTNAECAHGGGGTGPVTLPTQLIGGSDWRKVVAGPYHMLALRSDGTLWGWGSNMSRQIHLNSPDAVCLAQINADTDWVAVAGGVNFSLGIKADGSLWHWGRNFNKPSDPQIPPTRVGSANDWLSVAAGFGHAILLKQDGSLWAVGSNEVGEVGDGTQTNRNSPVRIGLENNWARIGTSQHASFAIKTDGSLWSWGSNGDGVLGHGTYLNVNAPTRVGAENHWADVTGTLGHVLAKSTDGRLWAWGINSSGQLGTGNLNNTARVPAIVGKYVPAVTLAQAPLPAYPGDTVTVTATVQGNAATATGTVTFRDGNTIIPSCVNVPLASGAASCTLTSIAAGSHPMWAAYSGDADYSPAQSEQKTLTLGPFSLALTKTGSGSGTVTSQPAGIDCGATCTADFAYNQAVTLTAVAAPGSRFTGFTSAECQPSLTTCTVTVDRVKNVSAIFALERTLTVGVVGLAGTVSNATMNCPFNCTRVFSDGAVTTLTANPSPGAIFMGWSGACSGNGPTCAVTMNANKTVTATFGYNLYVAVLGSGIGSVAFSSGADTCQSPALQCNVGIPGNTVVTLTATPGPGSVFWGWGGACSGMGPCNVTMNAARSVHVYFSGTSSVSLQRTGSGQGTVEPFEQNNCYSNCQINYLPGTQVTYTATPSPGSKFASWSGCDSVSGNQCTLTTNGARTIGVTFELENNRLVRHDFNDDGRADILLRNPSTGENYLYPMNGTSILAGEGYIRTVPAPWDIAGLGDFDGNGTADMLLRNSSTGENYIYLMNGTTIAGEGYIRTVPLAWSVAGVADLDNDGKADILWRNASTGENYLYPLDGLTIKGTEGYTRTVHSPWDIAGVADFDGDGRADILLRNASTGENYLYFMHGTSVLLGEGFIRTVPLDWNIAGLGDFDGDGKADILFRNTITGENYLYPMNFTAIKPTEGYIRTVPLVWAIASVADFDGDGKVDILLRNTVTGENYLYPMDGTNIKPTEGYVRTVPLAWSVVNK
jgi:alpha-tubulin suppressor-like RCC1 family protein